MGNSFVKKDEEKNKLFNILGVVVAVVIVGAFLIILSNNNSGKSVIPNYIKELNYTEFQEQIKKDEYTVAYIGSPTCYHCQQYKPSVNLVAENYDINIYYVNVSALSDEEYDKLHDSISVTSDQYDDEGLAVIPTPTTVVFKNGVEVTSDLGDIGYDGLVDLLVKNNVLVKK